MQILYTNIKYAQFLLPLILTYYSICLPS